MKQVKKLEAKLRVCLVLGTFPESLTRNHHLLFMALVFKTPLSYNREVHYGIVLHLEASSWARINRSKYGDILIQDSRSKIPRARSKIRKSRSRNQDPEIKIRKSRSRNQDPEIKIQKSRSRNQNPEIKTRKSRPGNQDPEIKIRKSRSRSQDPEIKI